MGCPGNIARRGSLEIKRFEAIRENRDRSSDPCTQSVLSTVELGNAPTICELRQSPLFIHYRYSDKTLIPSSVSVIIPCFNHGEFLMDAVHSVEDCAKNLYEIVIVNDGSTDPPTVQLLKHLQERGYNIINQNNQGLAAARNKGIAGATGNYILPLDADNKIRPEYIHEGIRILDRYPEVGVVYGNAQYFGDKSGPWNLPAFDRLRLIVKNYIDACAVFRREIWVKAGGYDAHMPFQGFEDWDLWLAAASQGWEFFHLREVVFDYRYRNDSMIRSLSKNANDQCLQYLFAKYYAFIHSEVKKCAEERKGLGGRMRRVVRRIARL